MIDATEKQTSVLNFISDFIERVGYPPTIRDIADHFSMSAKGAYDHVLALEKKGYIKRDPKISRSIKVL
jgi:repressor LexA